MIYRSSIENLSIAQYATLVVAAVIVVGGVVEVLIRAAAKIVKRFYRYR